MIRYTALRKLLPTHSAGSVVVLETDFTDAQRSRRADKNVVRAKSGRTETLYHSVDTVWTVTFAPVFGEEFEQLREFLASTWAGEQFDAWLYGSESAPLRLERTDDTHSYAPFMRTGARLLDTYTVSIQAIER